MLVYKFGGASVKNAKAVKNITTIIQKNESLIIVVSAMDKTTNVLEELHNLFINKSKEAYAKYNRIKDFHLEICRELFPDKPVDEKLNSYFLELQNIITGESSQNHDLEYDRIIPYGELFSSAIVFRYLKEQKFDIDFLDIRKILITDSNYREAAIDWQTSEMNLNNYLINKKARITISQGFIGVDNNGNNTSLGREGSDFTAAALAYMTDAKHVTIWKDVPGIMNADPAWCSFAEKLDELSFQEAIELAFYGAKVIHPKTIKPLENKNIPLYVKSFMNPDREGTVIKKIDYKLKLIPVYIIKENQTLISISPRDFSFIVEENISKIFSLFVKHRIKVNMTQNSAISFSASINNDSGNISALINDLNEDYSVKYNENLTLITIRHYTENAIENMTSGKNVLLEQRSRITARFVVQ